MGVSYKTRTKRRNAKTRMRRSKRLGFGSIKLKVGLTNPIRIRMAQLGILPKDPGTPTTRQEYRRQTGGQTGVVNVEGTPVTRLTQSGLPPTPSELPMAWEIRGRHAYQVPATPHHHRVYERVREALRRSGSPRLRAYMTTLSQGYSTRASVLGWNEGRTCYRWRSLGQAQSMLWAVWGLEPSEVSSVAGWDFGRE